MRVSVPVVGGPAFLLALALSGAGAAAAGPRYATVPGASFATVFPPDGKLAPARVETFEIGVVPVTNGEYAAFVHAHPEWRRGEVPSVFADAGYLAHWTTPESPGADARKDQPVTHVSWFAANAYCESQGARLPTWHEWELAAAADETRGDARGDPAWRERMLSWYSRPSTAELAPVGKTPANVHGIRDLHGLVWEWVDDHASLMVSGDDRNRGDPDLLKFCGAGALSVADRENYAVLMRIAMLSSLSGASTTKNVGFRCALPRATGTNP
jgi:formylglycine-generating enzyme